MSGRPFFISDLHLNHSRILEFAGDYRDGDTVLEHNEILITKWNSVVRKKYDIVYVLGDVVFNKNDLHYLDELNGRKILIRGNHDEFKTGVYLKYFEQVYGIFKYKEFWLTHCPVHPHELRGKRNIHGHVHQNSIMNSYGDEKDDRYINVCVEALDGYPVPLDDIRSGWYDQNRRA